MSTQKAISVSLHGVKISRCVLPDGCVVIQLWSQLSTHTQSCWVFGGVERVSGKCFLVEVPDRRAPTLENLLVQYVFPGTHIISDGWATYANLDRIANGIYTHSVVVHQQNFVDPNDATVHTNVVENMWMRAKRKLKRDSSGLRVTFSRLTCMNSCSATDFVTLTCLVAC